MRRGLVVSLVLILLVAIGGAAGARAAGWEPELGLDLQGGAYVVLQPAEDVDGGILDQSIAIIRNRVDALGVAEPDISRQGDSIIVQLPGVRDQQRALDIVGQTAELRFRPVLNVLPPDDATTTTTTSTTTTAPADPEATTTTAPADPSATTTTSTSTTVPAGTTPRDEAAADQEVILPEFDDDGAVVARYVLGPAKATGEIVSAARAEPPQGVSGDWFVSVDLTSEGNVLFNEIATTCFNAAPECPTRQVAIELDNVVQSAPTVQEPTFQGEVSITGQFTEREAKDLALVLRFGSLPVELEAQEVRTVSATLGRDSLNAGLAAGFAGLTLVLLYIILYYRALGVVVALGLIVWGCLQWSVISFLGRNYGLALSLAGAVGIVVSVGVTVDSYIVFFERLKDEIRSGKTIRSSVDRGFTAAFRTILAADVSSLIGAALLYWLTVGPVRGFALFLGLSTVLDLVVAYFFTRPAVAAVARSRLFTEAPFFGVARGLGAANVGGR